MVCLDHGLHYQGAFHFNYDGTRPLLYLGASNYVFWNDTSAQDDGEWHHWVVYANFSDISNSKLYVDGVLQTTYQVVGGFVSAYTEGLNIGGDRISSGNYFEGNIDEFAWFNTELTQSQITTIYNNGVPTDLSSMSGLSGYWRMGDGTLDNFNLIADQTNATLGSEIISNGDFATDSGWTIGTGWSISGGKANATDAAFNSQLSDSTNLVAGQVYKISFDVSNYVKGNVNITVGNVTSSTVSSDGSYTFYLTTSLTTPFRFSTYAGGSGTTLSVDNVSVKQVNGNAGIMTNMIAADIEQNVPS